MRPDPTAVPAPSKTPPLAPRCVTDSGAVIVGGGPVGATLAAVLHLRGVRVTLVERSADVASFDVSKSYTYLLNSHGLPVLRSVPGLLESFADETIAINKLSRTAFLPSGEVRSMEIPIDNPVQSRFTIRPSLVIALHRFLRGCDGVTILCGRSVTGMECGADGTTTLHLQKNDPHVQEQTTETLHSKLVFACDGSNSTVLRSLREQSGPGTAVRTARGLDDWSYKSPSSDLVTKSMLLDASIAYVIEKAHGKPVKESSAIALVGLGKAPRNSYFFAWPMSQHGCELFGGKLALFTGPPESYMLRVDNVTDAFEFLAQAFPQLQVRDLISEASMQNFVSSRGTRLGEIRRCKSLVAHVGLCSEGAVVLLGDAAHSFPPDLGQGVNCGLEDVAVFANALDNAAREGVEDEIEGLAERYEMKRTKAIDGIMYAMIHGFPWQYGQNKMRLFVWVMKTQFLKTIEKILPVLFSPPVASMSRDGVSYEEIEKRSRSSFRRLCMSVVVIAVAVVIKSGKLRA